MSFRTGALRIADAARVLQKTFGTVNTALTIVTKIWSGGELDSGLAVETSLVLDGRYKMRELTQREIASSGGRYEEGMVKVGPITPSNGDGVGYTQEQLAPTVVKGTEVIYRLVGELGGDFSRYSFDHDRGYGWYLILSRKHNTPL